MMARPKVRCINLDWLEVHALEPLLKPRDADYFRALGFNVFERPYGTRVFEEMFIIEDADGIDFMEVRRKPKSSGLKGIFQPNECHLRLTNRTCYRDDAAAVMGGFMIEHGYEFRRITRADICLDFENFDSGDDPKKFLDRYLSKKFRKVNQCHVSSHGTETWNDLLFNSISWGSISSDIGTKMYNKTLELFDAKNHVYKKPYIRQAWAECGLIDDWHNVRKTRADGSVYTPQIWRVEFSIRSSVRRWFKIEVDGKPRQYQSVHNTLDMYDSREKLLVLFASLARHYFRFKYAIKKYDFYKTGSTEGSMVRKDRCPDKNLFDWSGEQFFYKLDTTRQLADKPHANPFSTLAAKLRMYRERHLDTEIRKACDVLLKQMDEESVRTDLVNPFSREELKALQWALSQKVDGVTKDAAMLISEYKLLLRLNDRTAPF